MKRSLAVAFGLVVSSSCECGLEPLSQIPDPPAEEPGAVTPDPIPPKETGTIEGRICEPDGTAWFADADVIVAPAGGTRVESTTDGDGRFTLDDVEAGPQRVHITKGAVDIVRDVVVPPNDVVVIPEDECGLDPTLRIAVVHGSDYDRVEGVLEELGIDMQTVDVYQSDWAEQLLSTTGGLADYDILFLNCRSNEATYMQQPEMQERLRTFVEDGGSLYAADQAYDIIEVAWPDEINFFGNDESRGAGDKGSTVDVTAAVIDTTLADRLGDDDVGLHFGLSTWSVMVGVADDVETYIEADGVPLLDGATLDDVPMTVGFHYGAGHVVYSSFHEEPGIGEGQEQVLKLIMFEL